MGTMFIKFQSKILKVLQVNKIETMFSHTGKILINACLESPKREKDPLYHITVQSRQKYHLETRIEDV